MTLLDRDAGLVQAAAALVSGSESGKTPVSASLAPINAAWLCVVASLGLALLGVHAIDVAQQLEPAGRADLASEAARQLVFVIIGLIAAVLVALPHYKIAGYLAWPALVGCIGLLVFLLVPAVPTSIVAPRNGARAWSDVGPIDFQPSEVTKIAFVLVVALYLRFRRKHRTLRGLVVPGLIAAVPVGLITLQPDLGTSSLFVPALFAMLIAAGAKLRHLGLIVLCAALAAPAAYPLLKDHQKERLVAMVLQFQGDTSTAGDINYQSLTAQRLIGAGGAGGHEDATARTLIHYNRLPERHNDMVFAVIVNRFGFVGGLVVLGLYGLWIAGALLTAGACRDPLGRIIAVGLCAFVFAQAVVNIGMNIGVLPIIGITLPFVSYGGSSMVTSWLMTGLVMSVALHPARPPYRPSFEYDDDDRGGDGAYGKSAGFGGRALTRVG